MERTERTKETKRTRRGGKSGWRLLAIEGGEMDVRGAGKGFPDPCRRGLGMSLSCVHGALLSFCGEVRVRSFNGRRLAFAQLSGIKYMMRCACQLYGKIFRFLAVFDECG